MSTFFLTKENAAKSKKWCVVDAAGVPLGRLASEVALIIRGKHKATYTPHADDGDFVIVINAAQVKLTGKKWSRKLYHRHSGYPGGLKTVTAERVRSSHPDRLILRAVHGMLPDGVLGHRMRGRLKVYAGGEHPHKAQKPELHTLGSWQVTGQQ